VNKFIQNFTEGAKELARIIGLAVVSYLLTEGVLDSVLLSFGIRLDPQTKVIVVGLITTVLKSFDKWLHETGKDMKNLFITKGLTRF